MNEIYTALLDIIRQESSPEAIKAVNMIRRRVALENDIVPSRIPAPLNITQIGGYVNLLERNGYGELSYRMLASALGLPANDWETALYDVEPVIFFTDVASDRPACEQQASLPLTYAIRSDFALILAAAVKVVREAGAALPLMNVRRPLPSLDAPLPGEKQAMDVIGRTLEIAPGAALSKPETDPLIVTLEEDGSVGVYALAQNGIEDSSRKAYVFDKENAAFTAIDVSGRYFPLLPILAQTGWYPAFAAEPQPSDILKLRNITGLVPGVTTYGDELALLYTRQQIVASSLREMFDWVWNGAAFAQVE